MKSIMMTCMLLLIVATAAFAHGGEEHEKDSSKSEIRTQQQDMPHRQTMQTEPSEMIISGGKAGMDDFPTLHPLIVHFPIVLLLLAALAQLLSFFVFKSSLDWTVLFLLACGLMLAFVAGEYVHPHTEGLNAASKWVLEQHESYADYTIWAALTALVLKIAAYFFLHRNRWVETAVAICLIASAYCVSQAGHYGAQLTHIEGVGPQGKFIETESHEHMH